MISPEDLLEEAEVLLRVSSSEARRRTAISRAYYAAYHFLHAKLKQAGHEYHGTKGMHRNFLDSLTNSGDRSLQQAGDLLNSLYAWRIKADYKLATTIPRGIAGYCAETARYIFEETLQDIGGE